MKPFLIVAAIFVVVVRHGGVHAAVDKTLIPGEGGTDVVRAVLNKIDSTEIFSDQPSLADAFMRRMAFVETRDGESEEYGEGGVWNISEAIFMETKTYTSGPISDIYEAIDDCFETDWMNMDYEELQKPINSGIATRIYLHNLERAEQQMIPRKSEQDNYWMRHFPKAGATEERWNEAIEELDDEATEECSVNTDVAFVVDESGSIGPDDFELVKSFIFAFIDSIKDSVDDRIALIVYSDTARTVYGLGSPLNSNKNFLLQHILGLPYGGGFTNTPDGLCMLLNQPWRSGLGVLRFAIVITDGRTNRDSNICGTLQPAAFRVHTFAPPIQVFAIGIGDGIVYNELRMIASDPSFVSNVTSFTSGLIESQEIRSYEICNTVDQEVPVGEFNDGISGRGETTRLSFESSPEEGITLRLCVTNGSMEIFASSKTKNPNSALNEFNAMINSTNVTTISCLTNYFGAMIENKPKERVKRRPVSSDQSRLYVSLVGVQVNNVFSLNTSDGNMTYDVDECEEGPCHKDAVCINTDGSFYCLCKTGYVGNGSYCEDFDECAQEVPVCSGAEDCVNTMGSHDCKLKTWVIIVIAVGGALGILVPAMLICCGCMCYRCCCKSQGKVPTMIDEVDEPDSKGKLGFDNPAFDKKKQEDEYIPGDDSDDEWNYTLTLTWQNKGDKDTD